MLGHSAVSEYAVSEIATSGSPPATVSFVPSLFVYAAVLTAVIPGSKIAWAPQAITVQAAVPQGWQPVVVSARSAGVPAASKIAWAPQAIAVQAAVPQGWQPVVISARSAGVPAASRMAWAPQAIAAPTAPPQGWAPVLALAKAGQAPAPRSALAWAPQAITAAAAGNPLGWMVQYRTGPRPEPARPRSVIAWAPQFIIPQQFAGWRYQKAGVKELCLVAWTNAPPGNRIAVRKNGVTYAAYLVPVTDPAASQVRVKVSAGIMAIRLKT
jgi:hypothetical protein